MSPGTPSLNQFGYLRHPTNCNLGLPIAVCTWLHLYLKKSLTTSHTFLRMSGPWRHRRNTDLMGISIILPRIVHSSWLRTLLHAPDVYWIFGKVISGILYLGISPTAMNAWKLFPTSVGTMLSQVTV